MPVAVRLGRIAPAVADHATPGDVDVDDAVAEMEALYDAAGLLRSVPDAVAPDGVAVKIRTLLDSAATGSSARRLDAGGSVAAGRGRAVQPSLHDDP